jgi:hypothetical protein
MKKHRYKRKQKNKKAIPAQRYMNAAKATEAFKTALEFTLGLVSAIENIPEKEITEDAEFTIEDPKQLPPCQ